MIPRHQWLLVAPAYAVGPARQASAAAPVLQKYDTSELVNSFLKNPRTQPDGPALQFTAEDLVHQVRTRNDGRRRFFNLEYVETGTRKLFLDTHKRFYLVVCELHCDALGFPSVNRDAACEAGFVIRRREWTFGRVDWLHDFQNQRREGLMGLQALRREAGRLQARERIERWVPVPNMDGVGKWTEVTEELNKPDETIYPLYPLIPDPRQTAHPALGRTIYFGLVPTANTALDPLGRPQFDDESVYEIRCFVRQHKPGCPKKPTRGDCSGALVWSRPTEPYQLAAPFDLIGTSYRTINVKMPDLRALKAQAAKPGIGLRAPVRFTFPTKSGLEMGSPSLPIPGGPKLAGGICFRNIPLTTIVAMFAYNILKPIVTLIFQLYQLEPLEFCISTSAGLPDMGIPSPPLPPIPARGFVDPTDLTSPVVDISSAIATAKAPVASVQSLEDLQTAREQLAQPQLDEAIP